MHVQFILPGQKFIKKGETNETVDTIDDNAVMPGDHFRDGHCRGFGRTVVRTVAEAFSLKSKMGYGKHRDQAAWARNFFFGPEALGLGNSLGLFGNVRVFNPIIPRERKGWS